MMGHTSIPHWEHWSSNSLNVRAGRCLSMTRDGSKNHDPRQLRVLSTNPLPIVGRRISSDPIENREGTMPRSWECATNWTSPLLQICCCHIVNDSASSRVSTFGGLSDRSTQKYGSSQCCPALSSVP